MSLMPIASTETARSNETADCGMCSIIEKEKRFTHANSAYET